jgi:hypothetical protein
MIGFMVMAVPILATAAPPEIDPPPTIPIGDVMPTPTLTFQPVTHVNLGGFLIKFEDTKLSEVQKIARSGIIQYQGDAGDSQATICFTDSTVTPEMRIWLSSGEIEMSNVLSVQAQIVRLPLKSSQYCPDLPEYLRPVRFGNSLSLGLSENQIERKFGNPSETKNDWWFYSYQKSLPNQNTRAALLAIHFINGKAAELDASQVTTD